MSLWFTFVDLLRVVLFAFAHVCGGSLGGSIIVLSLIVRLALLPFTLRLALRAREYNRVLQTLKPQLDRLKRRHAKDPVRLMQATQALRAEHGLGAAPKGTLTNALVQMPIGAAVYQTVRAVASGARFLWVRDLSRPDALVASIAAGLAGAAVVAGPSTPASRVSAAVTAAVTFFL